MIFRWARSEVARRILAAGCDRTRSRPSSRVWCHLRGTANDLEQTAEGVIGVGLRLAGHGTCRTLRIAVGIQLEYPIW